MADFFYSVIFNLFYFVLLQLLQDNNNLVSVTSLLLNILKREKESCANIFQCNKKKYNF